jgi:hypothetical protein
MSGLLSILSVVHTTLVAIGTIVSLLAVGVGTYAYLKLKEVRDTETESVKGVLALSAEKKKKDTKWRRIEEHLRSDRSSDWKVAILEADSILDELVTRMGYPGANLGERLKSIEPSDFPFLDETWDAHKLRNRIAHEGADVDLSRHDVERAINTYHRVFCELGYL